MTIQYKVWLEIEEIDESRDHYQTIETPGDAIASFATYEAARDFVAWADTQLTSGDQPRLSATNRKAIEHIIDYLADEELHFESCENDAERENHIWHDRECLRTMLASSVTEPDRQSS